MTRPRGRVSRSYVNGYRDSWAGVVHVSPEDSPGRDDQDYGDGRSHGWINRKREAYEKYGDAVCDPDTCICNYCQGGPNGPW